MSKDENVNILEDYLKALSYSDKNLELMTYDWRRTFSGLGAFYVRMMMSIEAMYKKNNEKVVLVAHGTGGIITSRFLQAIKSEELKVFEVIHAVREEVEKTESPSTTSAPKGQRSSTFLHALNLLEGIARFATTFNDSMTGEEWLETRIHSFVAIDAPFTNTLDHLNDISDEPSNFKDDVKFLEEKKKLYSSG
jgi:hypothetical protein